MEHTDSKKKPDALIAEPLQILGQILHSPEDNYNEREPNSVGIFWKACLFTCIQHQYKDARIPKIEGDELLSQNCRLRIRVHNALPIPFSISQKLSPNIFSYNHLCQAQS